jgi:G2/mitotic-specific cyclin 3/4
MKLLPSPHYMEIQTEMQWSMRSILMEWLVQVHDRFGLLPETLFLAVNYIDRFLSVKIISLAKLQLVGATAILVAAKYEEINCPSLDEIIFMVDETYTTAEIMKAERFMLTMLQFELGWPGPMSFLRRSSKADDYDLDTRTLAKYFLEVTVMDERFVGSPCSFLAAGAHCLARLILKKGDWVRFYRPFPAQHPLIGCSLLTTIVHAQSPAHVHYSGYTWSQLRPLLCLILDCCQIPKKHHAAVYEKYADRRYNHCAQEVLAQINNGFTVPLYHPSVARQTASLFGGSNSNMSMSTSMGNMNNMGNCMDLAPFPAVEA